MTETTLHPDTWLLRPDLAKHLTTQGFPITTSTLAAIGARPGKAGSPPYKLFGKRALYRWGDALAWAQQAAKPRHQPAEM